MYRRQRNTPLDLHPGGIVPIKGVAAGNDRDLSGVNL